MIPFLHSSSSSASDVGGKKLKIKSSQPLIGTKTKLEVGEVVTQVGEEEDGYIPVITAAGQKGWVPTTKLEDFSYDSPNKGVL